MESDPGARDVIHDIVLADGGVVEILGANAYGPDGPIATFFNSGRSRAAIDSRAERVAGFTTTEIHHMTRQQFPTFRAVPADGDERAFG